MQAHDEELQAKERISGVFRSARKLRGLKQSQMTDFINVVQGTISKIEAGLLMPDAQKWYTICHSLNLDPDLTYRSGYVFSPITKENIKTSTFKLGKKTSKYFICAKDFVPFISAINEAGYKKPFERLLKTKNIDVDVFRIVYYKIPVPVLSIVLKFMRDNLIQYKNIASNAYIDDLKYFIPSLNLSQHNMKKTLQKVLQLLESSSNITIFNEDKNEIKITLNDQLLFSEEERPYIEDYLKYKSILTMNILKATKQTKNINISNNSSLEYVVKYVN
jgi:transcriptional regulator with XRE-family HTH domain